MQERLKKEEKEGGRGGREGRIPKIMDMKTKMETVEVYFDTLDFRIPECLWCVWARPSARALDTWVDPLRVYIEDLLYGPDIR